ncbi:MAG: ImmA/IrrE family metallo-endopeptidase [Dysgonomonas sp.]
MNTTQKGDAFEDRVYNLFKKLLDTGELGVDNTRTKVCKKKKYYSKIQEADITFDISIEVYMPKSAIPSFLFLVECKDYKSPIDVHKVRNFEGQIKEVGGHKGFFVTSSKFQLGAVKHAATNRMGLIVLNLDDDVSWIVRRASSENLSLTQDNNIPFLASVDNRIFTNILDFLSYENLNILQNNSTFKVNYLTETEIENSVTDSITGCSYSSRLRLPYSSPDRIRLYLNRGDDLEPLMTFRLESREIIGLLKEKYNIHVIEDYPLNDNELGRLNISNKTIYLSDKLVVDSPRWRFTLAHEFAHVVLHESILTEGNAYIVSDRDNMDDPYLRHIDYSMPASIKRMEIQANIFACYLLMPKLLMYIEYVRRKSVLGIHQPYLRLDDQSVNMKNFDTIVAEISTRFGVSKQVVRHKMYEYELVKDFSHTQSMRQSINALRQSLQV